MSGLEGKYGAFASYALHQILDAPRGMVRYLGTPEDEPTTIVVITALDDTEAQDVERRLCFREVASLEARLNIDGIITVREMGEHGARPYIVREYRGGVEISELIEKRAHDAASVPPSVRATLIKGIIEALGHAADADLIHKGLGPADVIVDGGGDVSVTGFTEGHYLARFGRDTMPAKSCPPELYKEGADVGPQADVYSIGMLFFRLMTGRVQPDEWEPRWAGMMMELSAADVPGEALAICIGFLHRTLAERPSQRYADVWHVARAFEPVLVELNGPKPRQVVASTVRDLLPPPPVTQESGSARESREAFVIDDRDLPPPIEPTSRDTNTIRSALAAQQATAPPDTRVMHSSQSLRSISPELREQISEHPLQILARSRYQVLGELGSGGTGTVYKVLDTTLSEILALKTLKPELVSDAAWLQRFKRELRITRDLEHPNILPAYHLEMIDGTYFFTMKFVDGETLYHLLQQVGPLPIDEARLLLGRVGRALAAAHKGGIVHRDFKSANIMIERVTDHPYLMDFGIAIAQDSPTLTMTGQGIGTPMYMAPEQAMGEDIGPQADIFSFGVTLYETITGELPFTGTTTVAVYAAQMKGKYRQIGELDPSVPPAMAALIDQCLLADPADRPATMEEVLERMVG